MTKGIRETRPLEMIRYGSVAFFDAESVTTTQYTDTFKTNNIVGVSLWVKATSSAGTPNLTLTLETAPDENSANFVAVTCAAQNETWPLTITDENPHLVSLNLIGLHTFGRFKVTLNGGDGGDDVVTLKCEFIYGTPTMPIDADISGTVAATISGVVSTSYTPVSTATAYSKYSSTAAEAGAVIKASAGRVYSFMVSNANAADRYVQFFNATSAPADTTVPVIAPVKVPAGGDVAFTLSDIEGDSFTTGIYVCVSSTQNTKTLAGTDSLFTVWYK